MNLKEFKECSDIITSLETSYKIQTIEITETTSNGIGYCVVLNVGIDNFKPTGKPAVLKFDITNEMDW